MSTPTAASPRRKAILALGALGVVYGDIGTSPLYALREALGEHAKAENVIGILSLIIWALISLIAVKYISVVMRADNEGEGGLMAMLALAVPRAGRSEGTTGRLNSMLVIMALMGTALLFGDGIITPAISVLSAVEGLKVAAPALEHAIIPITVAILVGLFSIQSHGTARVGILFGPITLVWFVTIGVLGICSTVQHPAVLTAVLPWHGIRFLMEHGKESLVTLGGVCLVITGGEALYADMGHFGRGPIRLAWWTVVLPALLLNYLGQGALVISHPAPETLISPLHELAPAWFRMPLVILGTMAAVIASQALISGAFSMTMQAIQLGFLPRMAILHTSESEHGQIYMPKVNWALMIGSIALVIYFGSSSRLAAAYGIAVCSTMLLTTLMLAAITRRLWHWPWWKTVLVCGVFAVLELAFVIPNTLKIAHGGAVPLVLGAFLLVTMLTWKRGRGVLARKFLAMSMPIETLISSLKRGGTLQARGTAVYLSVSRDLAPPALLHNLKHNEVLHKTTVILTISSARVPRVADGERVEVQDLGLGIWRAVARFGFMEQPDVPELIKECRARGVPCQLGKVSYFLGRETILPTSANLPGWQARYFALMSQSSQSAMEFFRLPANRVIELGAQIEI